MTLKIHSLTLGPVHTNCFIVGDEASRQCVVIDPADDAPHILETIASDGLTLSEIWITHAHFDHILALRDLKAAHNVPVRMHPADLFWLDDMPHRMKELFQRDVAPAPRPDIDLNAGDLLTLGGETFEVRFTPGHAPGHVIFVNDAHHVAFSGDCIFIDSIGRTDLPGGDYTTLMQSIVTQIMTLPADYQLYVGHGGATTVGRERAENPFIREYMDGE